MEQRAVLRRLTAAAAALVSAVIALRAHEAPLSTLDPEAQVSWGANIGEVHWNAAPEAGAVIGEYVCSGFLFSPAVGWIHLGGGLPADGVRYGNNSAGDFGVNLFSDGRLRGFAYGANIGWIAFEDVGNPRVDLRTGLISGFIYSANVGWITLSTETAPLRALRIQDGLDHDQDGIPDGWELERAGSLAVLSADGDADQDGQSDSFERLADTDPLSAADQLRILSFALSAETQPGSISWTVKPTRVYQLQIAEELDGYWVNEGEALSLPLGPSARVTLPSGGGARRFFRVAAGLPLR